jgi:hypothetical protein
MMCSDWLAQERARVEREKVKGIFKNVPRGLKHLAPVLWFIILGLVGMFVHFIETLEGIRQLSIFTTSVGAWLVVLFALGGCGFLYKAGVSDPGFICCGGNEPKTGTYCPTKPSPNVPNKLTYLLKCFVI